MKPVCAYVGLGSNLKNPVEQILSAFQALENIDQAHCVIRSPLYRSEPVGPAEQSDYINAVAGLETMLTADKLLQKLQAIEQAHGRIRTAKWGPRVLDLDLLLYGDTRRNDPHLSLPHPHMHERAFVLYPLFDIAPELVVPGHGLLKKLLAACPPMRIEQIRS